MTRDLVPQRVKEVFLEAADLAPEERAAFLDEACGGDGALRARVDRLLRSLDAAGSFLAAPTQTSVGGRAAPATEPLLAGTRIGTRYRIVELAGRGGMAEVYRAEDAELGQTVALKLLPEGIDRDEVRLARLREEVRVARRVTHPNVCRVHDIGEVDGRHFLTMEWIEGTDLATVLRKEGRPSPDRALAIARQIAAGIAAAHERGVAHRDLKPANVMIDERGVARITDFGLAAVVSPEGGAGTSEGTPRYMSPEQLAGGEVGFASDLYSLGLVLYELFTGRRCFPGESIEELVRERRERVIPPSTFARDLEPALEKLVLRCLETDPARRPASAAAVLDALPGGEAFGEAAAAAQRRADRIAAFRAEVAELRRAGVLRVSEENLREVEAHHGRLLGDLVTRYDVDVTERGRQLSLGMRAVSAVGAFALAASVYYFFFRIWGYLATPTQVGILAAAPLAGVFLTAAVARRERSGYFTLMSALVAFACLIVDTTLLGGTFNLAPSPLPMAAWAAFAMLLAYGYRLRGLLVVGLAIANAFLAASILAGTGGHWLAFFERPEGFLPGGLAILAVGLATHRRRPTGFAPVYRVVGVAFLVGPTVLLGITGWMSYAPLAARSVEVFYQVLGFAVSGAAIWLGIARRWRETVYAGTFFFVALLFLEFVNWWWAWMPKYLFFLIVALTSIAVLVALKRLRATLLAEPVEVGR